MKDDLNYVHSRVEQGHTREHDQEPQCDERPGFQRTASTRAHRAGRFKGGGLRLDPAQRNESMG